MDERERIQHELLKYAMKASVLSDRNLNDAQKQIAIHNIDQAAKEADWVVELLRVCGYLN
jgi:hypothetical protein